MKQFYWMHIGEQVIEFCCDDEREPYIQLESIGPVVPEWFVERLLLMEPVTVMTSGAPPYFKIADMVRCMAPDDPVALGLRDIRQWIKMRWPQDVMAKH
jgi:hypothetical protein